MPPGILHEQMLGDRTPPNTSGNMHIGVKNTFIEVMQPFTELAQRAATTPADMGLGKGGSSSDHQNQQAQQLPRQMQWQHAQQQAGDVNKQMQMQMAPSQTASYIDPATGVCMPVQMVAVPYMAPNQKGYPSMQFVDPSAFANASEGSMQPYDFSQQAAWFMPMTHAQFVPMNSGQMPMMEMPASTSEQNGNSNREMQQYHQGPMNQLHQHNNAKEKRPVGSKKQKEVPSTDVSEGPRAVLVDLSKLKRVNKGSSSTARRTYRHP